MGRIKFRELQRMTVKAITELLVAGPLIITVEGKDKLEIRQLDSQSYSRLNVDNSGASSLTVKASVYDPNRHYQPGDKVLIKKGNRLQEVAVPELDADGHPIY